MFWTETVRSSRQGIVRNSSWIEIEYLWAVWTAHKASILIGDTLITACYTLANGTVVRDTVYSSRL